MKMKPTITVADNGNLQIHIPMMIRRMRGRKTVIAPQALDRDVPGAHAGAGAVRRPPGAGKGLFLGQHPRKNGRTAVFHGRRPPPAWESSIRRLGCMVLKPSSLGARGSKRGDMSASKWIGLALFVKRVNQMLSVWVIVLPIAWGMIPPTSRSSKARP